MTVLHRYIEEDSILMLSFEGVLGGGETAEALDEIIDSPAYRQALGTVVDLRGYPSEVSNERVGEMIARAVRAGGRAHQHMALVARADGVRYAVAREVAAAAVLSGVDARVFADFEEAVSWVREECVAQGRKAG